MSRITKTRWMFHWVGAALGPLLTLFLTGCACPGLSGPVTPAGPVWALSQMPAGNTPVPEGVTLSYPGFDGGAFSAVLPVHSQQGELSPSQALEQIGPILRAAGFSRSLSELGAPGEALALPAPDLKALAEELCREAAIQEDGASTEICAALLGGGQPSPVAEAAIQDAYGQSFAGWKAELERAVFQYPFAQMVEGVPIEGAGISAFRREGESLSLIHGSLFNRFLVTNRADRGRRDAVLKEARLRLARQSGEEAAPVPIGEPELVLIPHGMARPEGGEPAPALRYAWRVLLGFSDQPKSWMVWTDAADGSLLRIARQWDEAKAVQGLRWRRDPGLCKTGGKSSCTEAVRFEVDPITGGDLALRLKGVFLQVNTPYEQITVADEAQGFNRAPVNRHQNAVCDRQGNDAFRQVNAYAHVFSLRQVAVSAGVLPKFPEKTLKITVDAPVEASSAFYDLKAGDAVSELQLGSGQGFEAEGCPDAAGKLNGAQDATIMAHETTHLLMKRLQERRGERWCGRKLTCQMPDSMGRGIVHDFCDGLAAAYSSTPCFGGWGSKNMGGANASFQCQAHSEAGGVPRLAELPEDRFPDHRRISESEYANGQIASAALWEIRKGMRSRSLIVGTSEYWVRLLRSLWDFGFVSNTCSSYDSGTERYSSCDRDIFFYLQDLERRMVGEWAAAPGAGRQAVNKVLSGWAKAGVYLTPYQCLDGDPATTDPAACPAHSSGRETAPDAVIEIDDRVPKDDLTVDGVTHPEVDYLKRAGPAPRFRIWTGPNYHFFPKGIAVTLDPPCGVRYEVEVAADAGFTKKRWTSGPAAVMPGHACEAEVDLPETDWQALRTESRIYYRVRTWDTLGRERISTSPGAGAFKVDPPFAVINDTGKP